ncbi:MAG: hypothetical protein ACLSVD_11000 [Eggerthellaceae bacterium]
MKALQLPLQTADLIAGFMVWVILSSLLPYIKQDVYIPPDQIALVTAIPVVLGSVLRVPFGYCANLFGARAVFWPASSCSWCPCGFERGHHVSGIAIGGRFWHRRRSVLGGRHRCRSTTRRSATAS